MKKETPLPIKETLKNLEQAFAEWEKVSVEAETEMEDFKKRTRELLQKLNDQMKALDL